MWRTALAAAARPICFLLWLWCWAGWDFQEQCGLCLLVEEEGSSRAKRMLACKHCQRRFHRVCLASHAGLRCEALLLPFTHPSPPAQRGGRSFDPRLTFRLPHRKAECLQAPVTRYRVSLPTLYSFPFRFRSICLSSSFLHYNCIDWRTVLPPLDGFPQVASTGMTGSAQAALPVR